MPKVLLLCLTVMLCEGCTVLLIDHVSQHEQAQKFAIPTSHQARLDVPFIKQKEHYCGPASLSMVSGYHGKSTNQQTTAELTFIPERQGSLQVSMIAATRSLGLVPYVLTPTINELVLEVRAGNPVIILQNNGLRFLPRWHYAVIVGYDTDARTFLLHSGPNAYESVDMDTFQRKHNLAKRWSLLALPIGEIPKTASPNQVLQVAADFETLKQTHVAQLIYKSAIQRWPNDALLYLGLGNTYMQQNLAVNACKNYRLALQFNPVSAQALNNYAYCANQIGCQRSAIEAAHCAVALDKTNNPAIQNTANQLDDENQSPVNVPGCPQIHCKIAEGKT